MQGRVKGKQTIVHQSVATFKQQVLVVDAWEALYLMVQDVVVVDELQQQVGSTGQQAMHLLKEGGQLMVLMQMHQGVAIAYYRLGANGQLQKLQFQHIAHSDVGMLTRSDFMTVA